VRTTARGSASGIHELSGKRVIKSFGRGVVNIYCRRVRAVGDDQEVQHMEEGYTQLGTVLTDQRQANSEGDGVIVVGRFKGDPYDGVQLSYDAGRRNLYLTAEGGAAPGITACGGGREGYRHPVGITPEHARRTRGRCRRPRQPLSMTCGIQGNLLNTLTRDGRGTASPRRRMTSHSGETCASCR
jgi:hypothetical protein